MDKSKINMHKKMAMTGHYRGGGIAHGGMGKAMRQGGMGGRHGEMMYSRGYGVDEKSKRMPTMLLTKKKGGHIKKQGYKAREDESIGMRRGRESGKRQSMKDRRDESYGAWGKRKSGKINKKRGGHIKKQGYAAREDESLGMRTGKESGKKQSFKARRDESYGAWGRRPDQKINKKKGGSIKGGDRPRPQGPHMWVREKHKKYKKGGHTNTRRENRLEELGRVDAERGKTRKGKRNLRDEKRRIVRELKK